jgi:hypothetical protein
MSGPVQPFENRTFCPVFEWFFQNGGQICLFTDRKPDKKIVRKMTIRISDGSVFGGLLYVVKKI